MAGTITALIVQKHNKERVNVYLDGEFAFGLAMIEALNLRKGQILSDEEIQRLKSLDEIEQAQEHTLNFLSYRPRSVEEVRRNLRNSPKRFSAEAIEAVIERLQQAGLLDDEAFARFWVDNRQQFGPRSAQALRYELRQKGVPDETIQAALSDLDESEAAYRAVQSRIRRYRHADERAFRKQLGDYLSRRGFSYSTIREVLNRLWAEMAQTPEHDQRDLDGEA